MMGLRDNHPDDDGKDTGRSSGAKNWNIPVGHCSYIDFFRKPFMLPASRDVMIHNLTAYTQGGGRGEQQQGKKELEEDIVPGRRVQFKLLDEG